MKKEYDHVYAVIRVDEYKKSPTEHKVTVKEIVRDREVAKREVERLNGLGTEDVRYFWQVTRIERASSAASAESLSKN